jgi:DNA polymerase (family 10)
MSQGRNDEVAALFEEFADLLEARDVSYKPRTYRRAAEKIREHPRPIEEVAADGESALEEIDGVGEAIASKIVEYVETGGIEELEEARADLPVDMAALTAVEGVGPKTVGRLYETLGVESLDDLEAAARNEAIREVKGFGAKTEENILANIPFARQARERSLLGEARPVADDLLASLRGHEAVVEAEVAGSIRRWCETVGDVDVLVASEDAERVVRAFTDWEKATGVIESGTSKASVRVDGERVDLRVVVPDEFGAALQYFTGSKAHNLAVRNRALARDLKVNEYGVFDVADVEDPDAGQRVGERIAGRSEEEMYAALDLAWIPPELREDTGEVDAAASGELPDPVTTDGIRGDLHTHTDWSDGGATIDEMLAGAAERGYDYHAVTDHATGPGMVGGVGLDDEELEAQAEAVEEAASGVEIEVFHGVEANVDSEGGISVDDAVLARLDVVVASPHAALDQEREEATERLVRAVEHPHVDVLGHPSGRLLNRRPGMELDYERIATAAADAGTALEVNANPHRLDLPGPGVRSAVGAGAVVAVNTDAHTPAEFDYVRFGVHTARRGWAESSEVLNTWGADEVRSFLADDG